MRYTSSNVLTESVVINFARENTLTKNKQVHAQMLFSCAYDDFITGK
jgi:hypothetical protein